MLADYFSHFPAGAGKSILWYVVLTSNFCDK
jgi:hypothetical protein